MLGDLDPGIEGNTVLETFDGFVDRIEGDTAFVTLQSRANGDVEEGTYSASQLARMGIHEQSCFVFKTVDVGNAIRPVFEPVPQEPVAAEVVREIDSRIVQPLPEAPPLRRGSAKSSRDSLRKLKGTMLMFASTAREANDSMAPIRPVNWLRLASANAIGSFSGRSISVAMFGSK